MNTIDDETLGAYVDGELDASARATVERAIAGDPELARRVAAQRTLRERLHTAYEPVLDESVPAHLLAAARGEASTSNVAAPSASQTPRRWQPAGWIALAASVVLGILLVPRMLTSPGSSSLFASNDGKQVARGELATQLASGLTSAPSQTSNAVRLGLSYRAKSGEYCRTFEIGNGSAGHAGVACHEASGSWRIDALERVDHEQTGPMRQASSTALPESLRRIVEASIDGDPLDAEAEAAAAKAGWPPAAPSVQGEPP